MYFKKNPASNKHYKDLYSWMDQLQFFFKKIVAWIIPFPGNIWKFTAKFAELWGKKGLEIQDDAGWVVRKGFFFLKTKEKQNKVRTSSLCTTFSKFGMEEAGGIY